MKIKTKKDRKERIRLRQRKRIHGTAERPRLAVFRSGAHIYAQVIDDLAGVTLASAASTESKLKSVFIGAVRGGNRAGAEALGKVVAEAALARGARVTGRRGSRPSCRGPRDRGCGSGTRCGRAYWDFDAAGRTERT